MENGQTYPLKGTLQFSDVTVDEEHRLPHNPTCCLP